MRVRGKKGLAAALLCLCMLLVPASHASALADTLVPVGSTVGIQLELDGVMVVGFADISMDGKSISPAADAGVVEGDIIETFNGQEIGCAADFLTMAAGMDGSAVTLTIKRGAEQKSFEITPVRNESGTFQLGVWLRDSLAGIGTVTYFDPQSGQFGALGHGVSEIQTGELMPVNNGSITQAEVVDVIKGERGTPGELCGSISENRRGSIMLNTNSGIFGVMEEGVAGEALPVAGEDEVTLGKAQILANVSGNEVREYEIEICRLYHDTQDSRSIMISVTDPELLEATGGIVQGMSGSPIIQNGHIIGAVTHVLINDPTKGYGIYIENMLEAAESCLG